MRARIQLALLDTVFLSHSYKIKLIVITVKLGMRSPMSERQYAMSDEHHQGNPFAATA
jgi:hypothetical protein